MSRSRQLKPLFDLAALWVVIGLLGSSLMVLANVGVGLAYHPQNWPQVLPFAMVALAVILLGVMMLVRRPAGKTLSVMAFLAGAAVAATGAYWWVNDPGDAMLYVGPVALGTGLVLLALEPKGGRDAVS